MSGAALFLGATAAAAAVALIGEPSLSPRTAIVAAAAGVGALMGLGFLLRDSIEAAKQVVERTKLKGVGAVLYVLVVLGLGLVLGGGGLPAARMARLGILMVLGMNLMQSYEQAGRSRAMGMVLVTAILAGMVGGPPAVLGVTGALVALGLFLVLRHHEQMREIYKLRRAPSPAVQALACLAVGGMAAAWCRTWFSRPDFWVGVKRMPPSPVSLAPGDIVETLAVLAVLAMLCVWGLSILREGRSERRPRATREREAVPERAVPAPLPWREPPPQSGPRRRIIQLYVRLLEHLQARGVRRRPDQTARELAARAGGEALAQATELFCRARYTSGPMAESDLARFEEAARKVREAGAAGAPSV